MPTRREFAAPLAIITFLTLIALYIAAYASLVEPRDRLRMHPDGCCRPVREPRYRLGGDVAPVLFHPVCQMDHWVRPRYWDAD